MIIDTQSELSDAQAVTSTAISANVLDLFSVGAGGGSAITPNTRISIGTEDLFLVVLTQTSCTDSGSDATLNITLESADDTGLTTNPVVHFSTGAMAFATYATAGTTLIRLPIPRGAYRRYLGLRYTVASGPLTAGAFDAFLTPNVDGQRYYRSGFSVQ